MRLRHPGGLRAGHHGSDECHVGTSLEKPSYRGGFLGGNDYMLDIFGK